MRKAMAELWAVLQEYEGRGLRRERLFRDRENPLEVYDDVDLTKKFRFPRVTIEHFVREFSPGLQRATNRNQPLTPVQQICAALRFFGKGTFQLDAGDTLGIQQASVSRSIAAVTDLICEQANQHITFPRMQEIQSVKDAFYEKAGFPNIIGLIDGTHIPLKSPPGIREIQFVCRKGGHSINIQLVCDADMIFRDAVVKYPGSTHDSFIWRGSGLRGKLIENPPNGHLLGDSGYPLEPWLMTPLGNPATEEEINYNISHMKTRRIVECAIGLIKSRFRCLDKSGGTLQYSPERTCKITLACIVLHNIRRRLRLEFDEQLLDVALVDDGPDAERHQQRENSGRETQRRLVNFFRPNVE